MSSNIEESHPDPGSSLAAGYTGVDGDILEHALKLGYVVLPNGEAPDFHLPDGVFMGPGYPFCEQHELPTGVTNPWKFNPSDPAPEDPNLAAKMEKYCDKHWNDMVYFLYRIEGGKFTTDYVCGYPKNYDEDSDEYFYNVEVPLTINEKPAKYTFTAYLDGSALGDCETYFVFTHVEFIGFPEGVMVDITELSNREYMHGDTTWGLR